MANPNRDTEYLGKLQDYYADYRNIPSYSAIGELLGMASKSAVSALVKRLTLAGFIEVTPDKRLAPTKRFFERELADFNIPAGLPAAANDAMSEAISLDAAAVRLYFGKNSWRLHDGSRYLRWRHCRGGKTARSSCR